MSVYPLGGPMLNLDYPNAKRPDSNDVDFVRLKLMGNGKGDIRQEHPFVVALRRLQAALKVLECDQLALIGGWSTGKKGYPHRFGALSHLYRSLVLTIPLHFETRLRR